MSIPCLLHLLFALPALSNPLTVCFIIVRSILMGIRAFQHCSNKPHTMFGAASNFRLFRRSLRTSIVPQAIARMAEGAFAPEVDADSGMLEICLTILNYHFLFLATLATPSSSSPLHSSVLSWRTESTHEGNMRRRRGDTRFSDLGLWMS